jgi:hypothetical protein
MSEHDVVTAHELGNVGVSRSVLQEATPVADFPRQTRLTQTRLS